MKKSIKPEVSLETYLQEKFVIVTASELSNLDHWRGIVRDRGKTGDLKSPHFKTALSRLKKAFEEAYKLSLTPKQLDAYIQVLIDKEDDEDSIEKKLEKLEKTLINKRKAS